MDGEQGTGGNPVVRLSGVSFAYGQAPVLQEVSLSVAARDMVAIVGPNGGGKTTLLKLLLGLLTPDSGTVELFGRSPESSRHRVGYMPQAAQYDPSFPATVLDVVLMGRIERHAVGGYSRTDRSAAMAALNEVGLADFWKRPFDALSGGQRQRVLIARALSGEPEALLLDEPTAYVDAVAGQQVFEVLGKLNGRLTILVVSHDVGFVSNQVDTVICVNRRVVVHPTSKLTGDVIREMYGRDLLMVRHDQRCSESGHEVVGAGEGTQHV